MRRAGLRAQGQGHVLRIRFSISLKTRLFASRVDVSSRSTVTVRMSPSLHSGGKIVTGTFTRTPSFSGNVRTANPDSNRSITTFIRSCLEVVYQSYTLFAITFPHISGLKCGVHTSGRNGISNKGEYVISIEFWRKMRGTYHRENIERMNLSPWLCPFNQ
jgi:hypothetical protein